MKSARGSLLGTRRVAWGRQNDCPDGCCMPLWHPMVSLHCMTLAVHLNSIALRCRRALPAAAAGEVLLAASAPAPPAPGDGRARRLYAAVREFGDLAVATAAAFRDATAAQVAQLAGAASGASALALLLAEQVGASLAGNVCIWRAWEGHCQG